MGVKTFINHRLVTPCNASGHDSYDKTDVNYCYSTSGFDGCRLRGKLLTGAPGKTRDLSQPNVFLPPILSENLRVKCVLKTVIAICQRRVGPVTFKEPEGFLCSDPKSTLVSFCILSSEPCAYTLKHSRK